MKVRKVAKSSRSEVALGRSEMRGRWEKQRDFTKLFWLSPSRASTLYSTPDSAVLVALATPSTLAQ